MPYPYRTLTTPDDRDLKPMWMLGETLGKHCTNGKHGIIGRHPHGDIRRVALLILRRGPEKHALGSRNIAATLLCTLNHCVKAVLLFLCFISDAESTIASVLVL